MCGIVFYSTLFAIEPIEPDANSIEQPVAVEDTTTLHYPVRKTFVENSEDLKVVSPVDLPQPKNLSTKIEYDPTSEKFVFSSGADDISLSSPFYLTQDEYSDYTIQKSMQSYWRDKNKEAHADKKKFSLTDIKIGLGDADKVFGPGGVQLKLQGSTELIFGLKFYKSKNPSLSERLQNPAPVFDFDEKIQLNVKGSVGDKLNFGLNYNTEATFDFDQSMLKLKYEGKEDEFIRKLEAGNVSMPLTGSLITGNTSLFGIKTEMQFGKLSVAAVVSQQESESKTVNLQGGAQTTKFEISADQYDENRHFFLAHYFRDNYDNAMSKLPNINSSVVISKVEVWVTNKSTSSSVSTAQTRNIVGFTDLAEPTEIYNSHWVNASGKKVPQNDANSLYREVIAIDGYRDITQVNNVLGTQLSGYGIAGGEDYVKVESARRLESSEYVLSPKLGFISLKTALNSDEVLAVAYEYTYNGKVYQVGEFSTDGIDAPQVLTLKLLKGTSQSPYLPTWDLMMKNIYSLGAYQVQKEKFRLDIKYKSDSTGVDLDYIPAGEIKNKNLLKVMNLDRLDSRLEQHPDGAFDFVEGYTVYAANGKIIFPVLEPFGSHLRKAFNDDAIAKKYVFQELYDSTLVVAQEFTEKNKFILTGQYKATSGSEIRLNATNIPRGSVKVTAGGVTLTENTDYTVDYMMGVVNILNQNLIESGTPISITLENQSLFSTQRKTLVGTHLNYAFSDNFNIGGTLMHLSEKPLTEKVNTGSEPISNTIWGLDAAYRTESQWLTNMLDKIPLLNLKQPSTITFKSEFAQLVPGNASAINNLAYIDDFESTKIGFDVRSPQSWKLASVPYSSTGGLFPEASLVNDIESGKNRALLAWYYIDPLFTRSTSTTPQYIKNDKEQLSNHFIREIKETEVFPNKELVYGQSSYLQTLNLAYYPNERGPYNIYADNFNADGTLKNPESKWGGIMRKLETTDFETNNIEYVEFWMLDPFVYDTLSTMKGGDLYFDLGDVSEDVLKDGRKFFENGLPVSSSDVAADSTAWGKVPAKQSIVYAFDNDENARALQDVGLDGLPTKEESSFGNYKTFVDKLKNTLTIDEKTKMEEDPFSPLNDPAGDNFHHFRGSDYDNEKLGILDRYKHYNGTEGNSPVQSSTGESYTTSATNNPDVEDVNNDNTMNEYEKYYEYKVSLRPKDMVVGENYISDIVNATVELKNGKTEQVKWYQFKIPIRDADKYKAVGGIRDFKSIRFMRMYLTDFKENAFLRFASLELVKGGWRTYTKDLYSIDKIPTTEATLEVSAVNIEENSNKVPVNYVLPPGVTRVIDPSQQQIRQENEQAMLLRVLDLSSGDARGVYKKTSYDVRQYERLQMFVHAEALADNTTDLKDNELKAFIRLGSDCKNNYYEYEIPLTLTPAGTYSTNKTSDQEIVWPEDNMFNFPFKLLTNLKLKRNQEKNRAGSSVTNLTPYYEYDPDNLANKVTIVGNPNLGEVDVIMVGIRNSSRDIKSGEVWVNELRMKGINEDGGVAALANLGINLSDFGTVNFAGRMETSGFGGIEQTVLERRLDDYYQYNFSSAFDLGKFFPEKAKVRFPVTYSYSQQISNPKYNPLDEDVLLSDALDAAETKKQKDSIKNIAQDLVVNKSFTMSNVKVGITSKKPMPYDPSNFSVSYAYSETDSKNSTTERAVEQNYKGSFVYDYSWNPKPVEPFAKIQKLQQPAWQFIRDLNFYYAPNKISFNTSMSRYYYEQQLRDLTDEGSVNLLEPSFEKDFTWNTSFNIGWDLTKTIKLSLTTNNEASISENEGGVDKWLYPDEYQAWKDSVLTSISHFGNPLSYNQSLNATWAIPINKIQPLNWITSNLKYSGSYNWKYGTVIDGESLGNTIYNLGSWGLDGRLNFEVLYNKSKYLKELNKRYASNNKPIIRKLKTFDQLISFHKGDTVVINHKLNDVQPSIKALLGNKPYKLNYKVVDANSISFVAQEDAEIAVNMQQSDKVNKESSNKTLDFTSRFLMMLRNLSFNYTQTDGTTVSGFKPGVGFLGVDGTAPGWGFVFGLQDNDFINKAKANNWLISDSTLSPAVYNHTKDIQIRALVEPIPGLKINLAANRTAVNEEDIQSSYADMPTTLSGNFSMSYIAIGTAFSSIGNDANYTSEAYEKFVKNRTQILNRLEQKRQGTLYPDEGFISETGLANHLYDASNGSYSVTSQDVLIPAFLAAYSGKDASKISLSPFPSFWSMLPNWQITYDGLSRIPWIKENFRSVNLTHAYNCKYQVGSYDSYLTYVGDGDFGYVKDVLTGNPIPSAQYNIGSVSINELFNPLIGIDVNMKNSLSTKFEIRKGRNLVLNLASVQLVETSTDEYVVGLGYKISDFDVILKLQSDQKKKVKNDLTLRGDFSIKDNKTIVRKIEEGYAQATTGDLVLTMKLRADYVFSEKINFSIFYDLQTNSPIITTSYPISSSEIGFSIKLLLTR